MSELIRNTNGHDLNTNCGIYAIIEEGYWYNTRITINCPKCGTEYVLWKFSKGGEKWCLPGQYPT